MLFKCYLGEIKLMSLESNLNNLSEEPSARTLLEELQQEKITLWGEIGKGWHWVVFIWNMMGSFGGIGSLLNSIKRTAIMLIKRSLIQLQANQRQQD